MSIKSEFAVGYIVSVEVQEPGLVFKTKGMVTWMNETIIRVKLGLPTVVHIDGALLGTCPVADVVSSMAGSEVEFDVSADRTDNELRAGYPFPSDDVNATFDAGDFPVNFRVTTVAMDWLSMDDALISAMQTWFDQRWGSVPGAQPFGEIRLMFAEMLSRRWQNAKNE